MSRQEIYKTLKEQREILGGLIDRLGKESRFSLEDSYLFESSTREVEKKLRTAGAESAN